uniref:Melanin-concentrating hormone receptor 1b n=1 Tax=Echeneis naucrates TaxID=173247 RepID=A0A665UPL7_ECHNA
MAALTPSGNMSPSENSLDHQWYSNVLMPSLFGVICFVGLFGNCVVIYIIVKKTKFCSQQTVPDIFILSLSTADLLFLLGMPFLIHQLVGSGSWRFGGTMCTVITVLDSNSQIVSTYILTVMTLDRYVATVHPIRRCSGVAVFSDLHHTSVDVHRTHVSKDGFVGCALLLLNPETATYWFTLYQFALPLVAICVVFFRALQNMSATVAPLKVTSMEVAICLAFFIWWAPYYILPLAHLGVQRPSYAFLYAYNISISMGYANVAPVQADGRMSLRMAANRSHPSRSQSSRELFQNMLPVTVAVC